MASALIVYGGWEGHDPAGVSAFLAEVLVGEGFEVERTDNLAALADPTAFRDKSLIVPVVTMADAPEAGFAALLDAVEGGTGIAGCHGGMCDSFRASTDWQFLTGGQFVAHPGDHVRYRVTMSSHPLADGMEDFEVETEQYYMHLDPAIQVVAWTRAPWVDGPNSARDQVDMPVAWTKNWGKGRVFYLALGHSVEVLKAAEPRELMRRGMVWAAQMKTPHR